MGEANPIPLLKAIINLSVVNHCQIPTSLEEIKRFWEAKDFAASNKIWEKLVKNLEFELLKERIYKLRTSSF